MASLSCGTQCSLCMLKLRCNHSAIRGAEWRGAGWIGSLTCYSCNLIVLSGRVKNPFSIAPRIRFIMWIALSLIVFNLALFGMTNDDNNDGYSVLSFCWYLMLMLCRLKLC